MKGGANTSSAVMQQRHEAHDSLDDFPTAPWATRAACEWIRKTCAPGPLADVREPCANRGHMAAPLAEYFDRVLASDVRDYGAGFPVADYLFGPLPSRTTWTITNPPFRLAGQIIRRALRSSDNVAMFVRTAFLEGQDRYQSLFAADPPSDILQFTERVVLWKGVLLDPDVPIRRWHEKRQEYFIEKPTSATAYAWIVWRAGRDGRTRFHWIPPCRSALTRPGDYPPVPAHLRVPDAAAAGAETGQGALL